jgi:hypothetical protein
MEKMMVFSVFVALSLILSMVSLGYTAEREARAAASEATSTTPLESLAGPNSTDIWNVKCKGKTTLCADVFDQGPNDDNTFFVNVVCIKPKKNVAADKAYAPQGGLSLIACVSDCKEALVLIGCDPHDFCDDDYDSFVECTGKDVLRHRLIQDQ